MNLDLKEIVIGSPRLKCIDLALDGDVSSETLFLRSVGRDSENTL